MRKKMTYVAIQKEVIKKYNITINENSDCWGRMHVHPRERLICKWKPKNSVQATFDLFHEIGHVENNTSKMRRCEEEYHATVWAIKKSNEYGIVVPEKTKSDYQNYIDMELDRGKRRGGKGYPENLKLDWDAR